MRTLTLSIAAIVCFGIQCAQAKPPVRVVNKGWHYSLEVPADWKRKTDLPKSIWAYIGPMDKGFAANVSVAFTADYLKTLYDAAGAAETFGGKDFELGYFNGVRKQYGKDGTVFDTKKIIFHGQTAYSYRVHTHFPDRPETEIYQIDCLYNGNDYVITFITPVALKKKYTPVGDQIIASFRFEK